MGKQINYYMGYDDFLEIAQLAVDSGCEIVKNENGKIICSKGSEIVRPDCNRYFFYLPEAGPLNSCIQNGIECIGGYNSSGNVILEAGFSSVNHEKRKISSARIYSITGYYDEEGMWIGRPECIKRVYGKLARKVKKIAPYTEITDTFVSSSDDDYGETKEWRHKEYITAELLSLKINNGYNIGLGL